MKDLWPEIKKPDAVSPVTIIKKQAALLGEKTNQLVIAEVIEKKGFAVLIESRYKDIDFGFDFNLKAPALNNYTYRLFKFGYNIGFYPVYFDVDTDVKIHIQALTDEFGDDYTLKVTSEDALMELLEFIFNHDKTRGIIGSMLIESQARSVD